jgi:hypothetical protein
LLTRSPREVPRPVRFRPYSLVTEPQRRQALRARILKFKVGDVKLEVRGWRDEARGTSQKASNLERGDPQTSNSRKIRTPTRNLRIGGVASTI